MKQNDKMMDELMGCSHDINCVYIILNRYGFPELTLDEIGRVLGITRERVRQIESSALKKLKHPKIGRILREYQMG